MPETVCSEKVSLVNPRMGPEGWAALNQSLPGVKLTEGAFTILFEQVLFVTDEQAGAGFSAALHLLDGLGLSKDQAYDTHEAIWDGAMEYVTKMVEAAFIAGAELGYRGLVVAPVEKGGVA